MAIEIIFGEPYTQWDWRIGQYVALIGIAGGAYLMGYVADVLSQRSDDTDHSVVARYGYFSGLLVLAVSPIIMLSHLGAPFRAMKLPLTMTNLGSWMALGSYLLAGFGAGAFVMFVWSAFGENRPGAPSRRAAATDGGQVPDGGTAETATGTGGSVRGFRGLADKVGLLGVLDTIADRTRPSDGVRLGIGALFGITAAGVLLYSAMALGDGPVGRVPLWDKTFLIPVQAFGGLGGGLALTVGLSALAERSVGRTLGNYSLAASGLLVVYLLALAATVVGLGGAAGELTGEYAAMFVGVGIVVGVVVPVALSLAAVFGRRSGSLSANGAIAAYVIAAALVLVGKIAVGLSYLMAAEFTPLPLPV